jgi:hypothetical protein
MLVLLIFVLIIFLISLEGIWALPSVLLLLAAAALLYDDKTGFASPDWGTDRTGTEFRSPNSGTVDQATFAETSLSDAVGNAQYKQYESDGLPFGASYAMVSDKTLKDTIKIGGGESGGVRGGGGGTAGTTGTVIADNPVALDTEAMYADIAQLYHYEDNPATNDDKLSAAGMDSGAKAKKSMDIRSHWNNNNVRRHFDYEMGIHEDAHREWWQDDDLELASKHVVI